MEMKILEKCSAVRLANNCKRGEIAYPDVCRNPIVDNVVYEG